MSEWVHADDGEYNEQRITVPLTPGRSVIVTIYSDRDGERWSCSFNSEEPFDLEAGNLEAARREAIAAARRS